MIASAIRRILAEKGHGTEETDLFLRFPSSPWNAIAVFAGGAQGSVKGLCPGRLQDAPGGQVQIRRETFEAAEREAYRVYATLDGLTDYAPSGYARFEEIAATPPVFLSRDKAEKPRFGVSFAAICEKEDV